MMHSMLFLACEIKIAHPPIEYKYIYDKLRLICRIYRLLNRYLLEDIKPKFLENEIVKQLNEYSKDGNLSLERYDEITIILFDLRYCLAMFGAPTEDGGMERLDIANSCVNTMHQLENYWCSVFA